MKTKSISDFFLAHMLARKNAHKRNASGNSKKVKLVTQRAATAEASAHAVKSCKR